MKLPPIAPDRKWRLASLGYITFCSCYTATQYLYIGSQSTLSPTWVDRRLPFIDWTIVPYLSQFLLVAVAVFLMRRQETLSKVFYSLALVSLLSFLIFFLFPTRIPHAATVMSQGLFPPLFSTLYFFDRDSNCLPSLHVSIAWLLAWGLWQDAARLRWLWCAWAAAITVSTLTTKQHYATDVVLGGLCALVSGLLVCRLLASGLEDSAALVSLPAADNS